MSHYFSMLAVGILFQAIAMLALCAFLAKAGRLELKFIHPLRREKFGLPLRVAANEIDKATQRISLVNSRGAFFYGDDDSHLVIFDRNEVSVALRNRVPAASNEASCFHLEVA